MLVFMSFVFAVKAASFHQDPFNCAEKELSTCRIWSTEKQHYNYQGSEFLISRNSLVKHHEKMVQLYRGRLWVVSGKDPVVIKHRFGSLTLAKESEVLMSLEKTYVNVRCLKGSLEGKALGQTHGFPKLFSGFEMRYSYVQQGLGQAETSLPRVLDVQNTLRVLDSLFPYHIKDFKEHVYRLGSIVKLAGKISAQWHKSLVKRKIANLQDAAYQLEASRIYNDQLDLYLRKVFRAKNNFNNP